MAVEDINMREFCENLSENVSTTIREAKARNYQTTKILKSSVFPNLTNLAAGSIKTVEFQVLSKLQVGKATELPLNNGI